MKCQLYCLRFFNKVNIIVTLKLKDLKQSISSPIDTTFLVVLYMIYDNQERTDLQKN